MAKFIPQELYDLIFNNVPRLCVDMVIMDKEDKQRRYFLMTRRDIEPYRNLWHLPGGMVRFKETISEAANRIAMKEFGVSVEVIRTIGACETMNDDLSEDKPRHSVSVVVEAMIISGTPKTTAESSEVGYFKKRELPAMMHPYHKDFVEKNYWGF